MLNQGGKPMIKLDSKGFTIIEVMIAMAIFAIGILGVTKLQITATNGNTTSRTMSEATAVVIDDIEKLLNETYDDITEITETEAAAAPITAESGAKYELSREFNDNTPINDVKQIITTVKWGNDREFTITTYRAK